jgi:hypothetical protein
MAALHASLHELAKQFQQTSASLGRSVSLHATLATVEAVRPNALQSELEALFALHPARLGVHFPK